MQVPVVLSSGGIWCQGGSADPRLVPARNCTGKQQPLPHPVPLVPGHQLLLSPSHCTQFHSTCSPVTPQQMHHTQQSLLITPTSVHGPCHATLQTPSRKGSGPPPPHIWKRIQSCFTLSIRHCSTPTPNYSNTPKEMYVRQSPRVLSSLRLCLRKDLHSLLLETFAGTKHVPKSTLARFQQLCWGRFSLPNV